MYASALLLALLRLTLLSTSNAAAISSIHKRSNATLNSDLLKLGITDIPEVLDDASSDPIVNSTFLQQVDNSVNASLPTGAGRQLLDSSREDLVFSGNYMLYQCDSEQPGGHADELRSLLPQVWSDLQLLIGEINGSGLNSAYGSQQFFKSSSNLNFARTIYQKIADGASIIPAQAGPGVNPMIACADFYNGSPFTARCEALSAGSVSQISFSPLGSNVVVLCPAFWSLDNVPNREYCPVPPPAFESSPSDLLLQFNQRSVLIHELAHMYLGLSVLRKVSYAAEAAIGLSAADSIKSPSNFALFYTGKLANDKNARYMLTVFQHSLLSALTGLVKDSV